MKPIIAQTLWDALMGALIAAGLVRVVIAIGAVSEPDRLTAQTEQAGFLPQFFAGFYVTPDQLMLMNVMAATVLVVVSAWAIARTASVSQTRASD